MYLHVNIKRKKTLVKIASYLKGYIILFKALSYSVGKEF